MKTKRPIGDAAPAMNRLLDLVRSHCVRVEPAGSFRRLKPQVGDLEIVAIPRFEERLLPKIQPDLFGSALERKTVNCLWSVIEGAGVEFSKRGEKYRQFVFDGLQVDLFTSEAGNFGWIWLIRTGSADFSHRMAGRLNRAGYTSRDGWIEPIHGCRSRIETPEEVDVFRLAREPWVGPERRDA